MSEAKAELHSGVKWSMEFDPSTGGYIPRIVVSSPDGESAFDDNALIMIDWVHYKVHEGDTYHITTYTGAVADNGSMSILLSTTGTLKEMHLVGEVACGGDAEIQFYAGVTGSNYGTPIPSYNLNGMSSNVTELEAFQNPTITVLNPIVYHTYSPGGTKNGAGGGSFSRNTEHILRPGMYYYLIVYNRGGGAKPMSIALQWYEEDQ